MRGCTHWPCARVRCRARLPSRLPPTALCAPLCASPELVPSGWDKWRAVEHLLEDLGVPASDLVAIGDGGNDLGLVSGAGVGVAMGNAVPAVRAAARLVVADNDSGGVAEAIERLLL